MNEQTGIEPIVITNNIHNAWIFQSNPKYYDLISAIENYEVMYFTCNQYIDKILAGDNVYFWVSGKNAGIVGTGKTRNAPERKKEPFEADSYTKDSGYMKAGTQYIVEVEITRKFTNNRILRETLMQDQRTSGLSIIKQAAGTNFFVTKEEEQAIEDIIANAVKSDRRYWIYSPGARSKYWDEFYDNGIMGIGWEDMGDLSKYSSREEIQNALADKSDGDAIPTNSSLALWQFVHVVKIGDIIFAKQGRNTIIGRGVVKSDYIFCEAREFMRNIRKVEWTDKGTWKHDWENVAIKTLTDVTMYPDYIKKVEALIKDNLYTEREFLRDVYIDKSRYYALKGLLERKKNIILQGAPGVGKTFTALRLAFSLIGTEDLSRIELIQFHQNYSYEDFVMGYRPEGNEFVLREGPFYKFCKEAECDGENNYFFIIDEINRGNLSKIFGELLMLIEEDKRGKDYALPLLYCNDKFFVPKNVYIIGMMNTADRSIALIDYALRRRFAFFELHPAFESNGFKERLNEINNPKLDKLILKVQKLNETIEKDESLGSGFRIGHSYFCPKDDEVDDDWLSSVIEYELLPLLEEYWFDDKSKIEYWSKELRSVLNA
ncbi:MAG: EVE domain-containing protein [Desulfovibrio sp.]|jgi:MoxR-like ATPase|nr:EVE domain-containing protein [Desulfovibrio sp.]